MNTRILKLILTFATWLVFGNSIADVARGAHRDRSTLATQEEFDATLRKYLKDAEQGDPKAQIELGVAFERRRDFIPAKAWYEKAARQGNAEAQFLYSKMFNGAEQFRELRKSAEMGYPWAQYEYAQSARSSKAIDQNQWFRWMLLAAEGGVPEAQYGVATAYLNEGMSKDDKDSKSIQFNEKEAFRWLLRLAEANVNESNRHRRSDAQARVGWMYYEGRGVRQNYSRAFEWFNKAADDNNYRAFSGIAAMYNNGHFVEKNPEKAKEWASKAKPAPVTH